VTVHSFQSSDEVLREAAAQARRDRASMRALGDKFESPAQFRRRMRIRGE
jgi:hypothetical protein